MTYNPLLNTDSYKFSHWMQYPPEVSHVFSYLEARDDSETDEVVVLGGRALLTDYLSMPVTNDHINEAREVLEDHGMGSCFNEGGFNRLVEVHGGYWPVSIKAVPEGTVVAPKNAVLTMVNNDPLMPWVTGFLETMVLRAYWYPSTVATKSREIKKVIMRYLEATADYPGDEISFKLHDFGARGCSSYETSIIGGLAHLVNFKGSDTIAPLAAAKRYYGSTKDVASSIPAAEHSTIISWGRDREAMAYLNMVDSFGSGMYAVVSDSYNVYRAVSEIWGDQLRDAVVRAGGTLVVRPDSGDPVDVVVRILRILDAKFGCELNSKGFKVLRNVRVIQGDGVTKASIARILAAIVADGYSATNVAFGMGGALLQDMTRDDLGWAMKASAVFDTNKNAWVGISKSPIDQPGKKSKSGLLILTKDGTQIVDSRSDDLFRQEMQVIYSNNYRNDPYMAPMESLEKVRDRCRLGVSVIGAASTSS